MSRILAFSTNISAGHRRAAEAIAKAIEENDPCAEIAKRDALDLVGPSRRWFLTGAYLGMLRRRPDLWDNLYRNEKSKRGITAFFRLLLGGVRTRFEDEINRCEPDLILCTQAIPARIVADLKRRGRIAKPLLAVATDYGVHPYWADPWVDAYAVPSEKAREELIEDGVEADRIYVTGIPVDGSIMRVPAEGMIREEFAISRSAKVVLIMGGGNGLGFGAAEVREIEEKAGADEVLVVTGGNHLLRRELTSSEPCSSVRRRVFSEVANVEKFFRVADVIVSKPGGLTMAEATAMGKAIVLLEPLPGQEIRNAEFLLSNGAALGPFSSKEALSEAVRRVLEDDVLREKLQQRAREVGKGSAAEEIARLCVDMIERFGKNSAVPRYLNERAV
ncbi:MAG: glycosyltransferase [Candidatus Hydrogenedentota bacterium]|nr:MAG: glycosyltransferase [Candidatus Hydrogenedentota bacterium]